MTAHPVLDSTPPEDGAQGRSPRWHHLDALRGFAMVLGIGLHVSLAFVPWVWPAQDVTSNIDGFYDEFFHAVHGFRMPLFFLLSGFFTAMLWRRRGLRSLVEHRIRRIAIPLALGMVTIVPVMNWSIDWAIDNGVSDYIEETGDIWAAAFFGNDPAVAALLEQGTDVNAANPADSRLDQRRGHGRTAPGRRGRSVGGFCRRYAHGLRGVVRQPGGRRGAAGRRSRRLPTSER